MSQSDVTREGLTGVRPDREAVTGAAGRGRRERRRGGEAPTVPDADFRSYYGLPVLNPPVWEARDIAGYLFLGGLAGGSSVLAEGAALTGRPRLARAARLAGAGASALSLAALVHDLGRPARFLNMLRVLKPTSPMSVGSWLLAGYGPAATLCATTELTGRAPRLGRLAGAGAAALGPAVATYTSALLADTAVPAWHAAYRELPFAFAGSAATAAGGVGLLAAPVREAGPARGFAVLGAAVELAAVEVAGRRLGLVAEPYHQGRAGVLMRVSEALTAVGALGAATVARRNRAAAVASGTMLLAGSACGRFGIFRAGMQSAEDPRYTVQPQRERLDRGEPASHRPG